MTERWVTNWPVIDTFVPTRHETYSFISPSQFDLSGKTVFITGASKGVGRATAISFAQAGASKIVIAARSSLASVETSIYAAARSAGLPPPQVLALELDVSSDTSVRKAAFATKEKFGNVLDVLVNNAGYLESWVPMHETDPMDWWKSWEVNMKGPYLCTRHFLPMLLKSETKLIVNVSSAGANMLNPGGSAYDTARFALCRFTEFVEAGYADQGLIAVSLHPGSIKTDLSSNLPGHYHEVLIDEPEMPADTIVWLAGERREWLNGRFVSCNWDVEELLKRKQDIVDGDLFRFRMTV